MKRSKLHPIINSILLIVITILGIFYVTSKQQSMAYVNNVELFKKFDMTKDMTQIEDRKIKEVTESLDNIYRLLEAIKSKNSNEGKRLTSEMNTKTQELQALKNNYENVLTQNVWNRLNTYIADYSKANDISIVFGTSGNGNVMYAMDYIDITNDILKFSNSKYAGN